MATEMILFAASHSDQCNSIKWIGVNGSQTHLGLISTEAMDSTSNISKFMVKTIDLHTKNIKCV